MKHYQPVEINLVNFTTEVICTSDLVDTPEFAHDIFNVKGVVYFNSKV